MRGGRAQDTPFSLPQIGHRDFDVEKRLRRDLRRTRALLADVQLLLAAPGEPGTSAPELERLRKQVGAVGRAGIALPLAASLCTAAEAKPQEIVADLPVSAGQAVPLRCASIAPPRPGREVPLVLTRVSMAGALLCN